MEAGQLATLRETLDRLRVEVTGLRASRERLVLAADADRHRIERDLHEGVQQHLVALAVNLQLAGSLVDVDAAAAMAVVEEMQRDVRQALHDTARLAQGVYPTLLEAGGLAAALRAAAVSARVAASVDVVEASAYPPELARTVYFCWLEALEHAGGDARLAVTVREEEAALTFEFVVGRSEARLDRLRDRVEALGGWLTVEADSDRGTRVHGSLPLVR